MRPAPGPYEYCSINGSGAWGAQNPRTVVPGSDPSITANDGLNNIAMFGFTGGLYFYWEDSNGGWHQETVDPLVV